MSKDSQTTKVKIRIISAQQCDHFYSKEEGNNHESIQPSTCTTPERPKGV